MEESNNTENEILKQRLTEIPSVHKTSIADIGNFDSLLYSKRSFSLIFQDNPIPTNVPTNVSLNEPASKVIPKVLDIFDEDFELPREEEKSVVSPRISQIPPDTWLIGGTLGSRSSLLVFRSCALAGATNETIRIKPGFKLHVTYKVVQAETKLLARLLDCHGITEVPQESNDFNLLWTGSHPKPGVFRALTPHQRINHFPRSYELTRKDRLYKNIERMQHSKGQRNFDFVPQTFVMPGDFKELCSVHYKMRGPWIVKPVASSRGRGIFIVETPYQVPLDEPVVVAKYISNPLLVGGHKCDLRLYVAVTSFDPLIIYIYEEGLVRFATVKYDTCNKQLWNPCMHLCNYSINKYHSDYIKSEDPSAENVGHKWTLSALLRHLKSERKDTGQLMAQIEDIVVKSIITSAHSIVSACQMFVPNLANCFELFGFDILVDEELKPWLIEVNLSPSLGCESPLDVRLKSAMLSDLLTLIGLPAVDPVLKPHLQQTGKSNSALKMKFGTCRRVYSADGLSQSGQKSINHKGRLTSSTYSLTPEETRLVKFAKSQFERRGGWVRIFPTVDSWTKYSQYLDPISGIPCSALPSAQPCKMVVPHNYNHLLYSQLFPDIYAKLNPPPPRPGAANQPGAALNNQPRTYIREHASGGYTMVSAAGQQRHNRYERQLTRGHRAVSFDTKPTMATKYQMQCEETKEQICSMMKSGKVLTQYETRRTFSQYLNCVLRRMTKNPEQSSHIEVVLNFLQRASSYLRIPFDVKVPSSKMNPKDRTAIAAKQLNDFIYLYNRETEIFTDMNKTGHIPHKMLMQFLQNAEESDLEEVLTLQTMRFVPQKVNTPPTNCGFQGLLKCLNTTKTVSSRAKKIALKVAKPS